MVSEGDIAVEPRNRQRSNGDNSSPSAPRTQRQARSAADLRSMLASLSTTALLAQACWHSADCRRSSKCSWHLGLPECTRRPVPCTQATPRDRQPAPYSQPASECFLPGEPNLRIVTAGYNFKHWRGKPQQHAAAHATVHTPRCPRPCCCRHEAGAPPGAQVLPERAPRGPRQAGLLQQAVQLLRAAADEHAAGRQGPEGLAQVLPASKPLLSLSQACTLTASLLCTGWLRAPTSST